MRTWDGERQGCTVDADEYHGRKRRRRTQETTPLAKRNDFSSTLGVVALRLGTRRQQ